MPSCQLSEENSSEKIKDLSNDVLRMNERLPLTDEMRKQASSTIESLNERMGSLNQKAQQIRQSQAI